LVLVHLFFTTIELVSVDTVLIWRLVHINYNLKYMRCVWCLDFCMPNLPLSRARLPGWAGPPSRLNFNPFNKFPPNSCPWATG
jgi:hypothetical protein